MPTSSKVVKSYESQFEEVFSLKEKCHFEEGIVILKKMNKEYRNDKKILGMLGTLYYQNKDYPNSSKYFKKALKINPDSELSSLGLFHSYIHLGQTVLGLKEIRRFCKSNTPNNYRITIKELNKNIENFNEIEKKKILNLRSYLKL